MVCLIFFSFAKCDQLIGKKRKKKQKQKCVLISNLFFLKKLNFSGNFDCKFETDLKNNFDNEVCRDERKSPM